MLLANELVGYKVKPGKLLKNVYFVTKSPAPVDFIRVFISSEKELET